MLCAGVKFKDFDAGRMVWHRDEDPALEASEGCDVELPGHVGCGEDGDALFDPRYLVHLPEELRFDPPFCFALIARAPSSK